MSSMDRWKSDGLWKTTKETVRDSLDGPIHHLDALFDAFRRRTPRDAYMIQPYFGHACGTSGVLTGRVIQDSNLGLADEMASSLDNVFAMYKRFESDEVPGAVVRARLGDQSVAATTDDEGFFELRLELEPSDQMRWVEVDLELTEPASTRGDGRCTGRILQVPETSNGRDIAILSDLDDTVIQSGAANFLVLAVRTLFGNAATRQAFPGVDKLYRAFVEGGPIRPIFYVSNGPRNLYDFLSEFFAKAEIPDGPIFLRNLGSEKHQIVADPDHKMKTLKSLLETFPNLDFVLIGDSGEKDPEIYRDAFNDPALQGRIKAIYIRDASDPERDAEVREIAAGIDVMKLCADSAQIGEAMWNAGWIDAVALADVEAAVGRG